MGTFSIRIGSVFNKSASVGAWYSYINSGTGITDPANYSSSNTNIITAVRSILTGNKYIGISEIAPGNPGWLVNPSVGGTGLIEFLMDLTTILIDGVSTNFFELRPGFVIITANFKIQTNSSGGITHITRDGFSILTINPDSGSNSAVALDVTGTAAFIFFSVYGSSHTTLAGSVGQFTAFVGGADVRGIVVDGTYIIISFSWRISTGTEFTVPAAVPYIGNLFSPEGLFSVLSGDGDINNIYSASNPSGTGVDLKGSSTGSGNGINSIIFSWLNTSNIQQTVTVNNADFDEWTIFLISFYLPNTLPENTYIDVTMVSTGFPAIPAPDGTGTQFSGSVKLGTIKILTTAASGIYRIVTGQTHDTIYVDNPISNTTNNFAIPDPFAKTGFIGG